MEADAIENFENIDDKMLWKGSALKQIESFKALAARLGARLDVVGSHCSKSIRLPVVRFSINGCHFYLRDNFYDLNLCVLAVDPIHIPLAEMFDGVYEPQTWDWYLNEIARCRGYSWREWSDEQMDDPKLLQLTSDAPSFLVKSQKEKDNWIRRMTDPTWWWTNWAGGLISWDGDFGPGAVLWIQGHPFMQGIEDLVPARANQRYAPGCSAFSLSVGSYEGAELIILRVSRRTSR